MADAWLLTRTTLVAWNDDHVQSMGAALAYYTMFSIAPVLLLVISIAGLVFGEDAARGEIAGQLQDLLGEQGALAVQALIESVRDTDEGLTATMVGAVLLLIGATTVFGELQDSLDRIWRTSKHEDTRGVLGLLRARILSFGMILGIGFVLMVSLIFSAGLSAVGAWSSPWFGGWETVASVVNLVLSFALTVGMFALIYKIMPRVQLRWREVWIGAVLAAFLFNIGKFLIGFYIGRSAVTTGFGVAGSLVALLIWVYWSAQIFLLGAEFIWAYSNLFGSRRPQAIPEPVDASSLTSPARTHGPQ